MKKEISTIHNLTEGGGNRYYSNVISILKQKYKITEYRSKKLTKKNKLIGLVQYLKYIYIDLPKEYELIVTKINKNKYNSKTLVFQDAYIKTPNVFKNIKGN